METNKLHINDWKNINSLRIKPNWDLIKSRIKTDSKLLVLEIWENLNNKSIPCLLVEVTNKCKNKCDYCYQENDNLIPFDLERFKNLIQLFKDKGLISVWITGGEPLHDFSRFQSIINLLKSENIDVERISTSFSHNNNIQKSFIKLFNEVSSNNKLFKCTLSISLNSYLKKNTYTNLITRINELISTINTKNSLIHFPVITNEKNGEMALNIAKELHKLNQNFTYSTKSLVSSNESIKIKNKTFRNYMDCGIPSLFPCTWPMYHLKCNGELYCCSTWFNTVKSSNYLGNISSNIKRYKSKFMCEIIKNNGWYNLYNNVLSINSEIGEQSIYDFDDNTQKCLVCFQLMKNMRK